QRGDELKLLIAIGAGVAGNRFAIDTQGKSISCSRRATVLGETEIPCLTRTWAIFSVVFRVHFIPVMGSPAVSCSRIDSMAWTISGVFFPAVSGLRRSCVLGPLLPPGSSTRDAHEPPYGDRGRAILPHADRPC